MDTRSAHRSTRTREGAALVMTMGTMLVLVIVLLISSQYTVKSMRTVQAQTTTVDAQYIGESGLAWAQANADLLRSRFMALRANARTPADFTTLMTTLCPTGNLTVSSGCDVDPTDTVRINALINFFTTWDNNSTDGLWNRVMTMPTGGYSVSFANGQSVRVYNTYKPAGSSAAVRRPLFAITRVEWDRTNDPTTGVSVFDTFRFCYDIGYYVSQGTTVGNGNRLVGQRPAARTTGSSTVCASASTPSSTGLNPVRNYIEIDARAQVPVTNPTQQPQETTIPPVRFDALPNAAGAVNVDKVGETATTVTYRGCGQTSQPTASCASNTWYYFSYDAAAGVISCYGATGSKTATTILPPLVNGLRPRVQSNTLYSCLVNDQGNAQSNIYFVLDNSNPKKMSFILQGKTGITNGNNTVGKLTTNSILPSNGLVGQFIYMGNCLAPNELKNNQPASLAFASGCTEAQTVAGLNGALSTYTPGYTTTVMVTIPGGTGTPVYTFNPATASTEFIFGSGRWVQLSTKDL